jgi:hypothetical protein
MTEDSKESVSYKSEIGVEIRGPLPRFTEYYDDNWNLKEERPSGRRMPEFDSNWRYAIAAAVILIILIIIL